MKVLSQRDLLGIVARAATIEERLDKGFLPSNAPANEVVIRTRLDAWCQTVANGDWEQFRRRLAWDDLDEERVRHVLGAVRMPEGLPLPAWAETLGEAVRQAASSPIDEAGPSQAGEGRLTFLDANEPLPFEEILIPFVLVAQRRCVAQAGDDSRLLGKEAHASMHRSLLQTLTSYAAQALYLEFSIERFRMQSPWERVLAAAQGNDQRRLYQAFAEQMLQGGLVNFFREYAVLARLLATLTDLWVEATVEFLRQLAADWTDLQQLFGGESDLGRVAGVAPSLSDPHRGGRRVIALTFASGCKVVYKPKDLGTEDAYYRLLAWCNERSASLPLTALKVLNRSSHGWVEFVEHEPCRDREEAQRYYRRAGMLLCLVYALEGTDCHYENIIAAREHPVLVDMETLLHHRADMDQEAEGAQAQLLAIEQVAHSVLRTGLLPNWQVINDGRAAHDVSGLGANGEQEIEVGAPQWRHLNTDRMTLEQAPVKMQAQVNGPLLDGARLRLEDHSEDLLAGFQRMYRFLLQQREALLADDGPLHELAGHQVRFLYRATRIYGALIDRLLHPTYLRDGIERGIQLELLGRAVLPLEGPLRHRGERPRWWSVFAAERQAMMQGDVPFFTARANSRALIVAPGQHIEACFEEPSFHLVATRLKTLDDEDLERQVALIQGALYSHVAREAARTPGGNGTEMGADSPTVGNRSAERLVARALALAEQIARRAIRAADGSVAWIAPQYLVRAQRYQLQPMGYELYDGTCGVALFLAALERVSGGAGHRELALGAVQPLRRTLREYGRRTARDIGIGGASGLGSIIYALTRIGQWLDEAALLEDARRAASLVTAERIADDRTLDIIGGTAGAILGLLAFYAVSRDEVVLDRAITCGQHLVRARIASEGGYRTWPTLEKKLLTGFSHGAAGIAYALLRLYAVTRNGEVLAAAREGIAYEDSVFVPEVRNWPDFREERQPAFMTTWCHGAPGIALGRLGGLAMLDSDDIRRDIDIAVQTTRVDGIKSVDQLCCGRLGTADVLLVAASRLVRPDLAEVANQWVWQTVARAEDSGTFALHPLLPPTVYCPGFFQGTAGIGYELLRVVQPDALPSVLLWE